MNTLNASENTSRKVTKVITAWCFLMLMSGVANAGRAGAGAGQYQTKGSEFVEIIKGKPQTKSLSSLLKTTKQGVVINAEGYKGAKGFDAKTRYFVECYERGKEVSEEVIAQGLERKVAEYGAICRVSSVAYVAPKDTPVAGQESEKKIEKKGYFEAQKYGFIKKGGANYNHHTVKGFNAKILMYVHLRHVGAVEGKKTASIVFSKVGVGIQELVPRGE